MRQALITLFAFLVGIAAFAQDPGSHRIPDAQAQAMVATWSGSSTRPGNMQGDFIWSKDAIQALLGAPGAAQLRFHFGLNLNGDVTVLPASLDASGNVVAWIGNDVVAGIAVTPDQAASWHSAWKGAKLKPWNAAHTVTYPADSFRWLMNLPGAAKLRSSIALDSGGKITLVSSALDNSGAVVTADSTSTNYIDAGDLCPPVCK